ncbi:hypothetical protein [Mycobacterium sp. PSTR-4-N]|uniref:hypothetical protein n=1 Tax=Mycobacterium sp. PSTR-4-N TaxID=2917745 RepID=UPI001F15689B|nr:hypothetical protein [Mycobacterium sp. PSTR-4-N]MCG7595936.1 hypothetical protein [Mycobacterium sp. PSTR-4-N]
MPGSSRIVHRNSLCLGVIAVAFGATIIGCHIESGGRRWAAAAWTFALKVPGSPATWGGLVLVAGVLIIAGYRRERQRLRIIGCWLAFWWFTALAAAACIAFAADLIRNEDVVNPLSLITWLCFAAMFRLHIRDEHGLRRDA